jgi:rare lipoprotein A (peptidoglycan hydrolase)
VETKRKAAVWSWTVLGVALVMVLAQASCAHGRSTSADRRAKTFVGLASFYGPGFHGKETANGEIFNQRAMTAAHRTLPLGTVVRVTNLENGRSVVVRINDRGPYGRNYRRGTIIDMSKGAAQRLRFIQDGLVRVRVEVVEVPDAGNRP